jgi:hypothetical protein
MSSSTRKAAMKPRTPDARAKVFWTGRSQAVRLPKAFRLDADEVKIHRDGNRLILEAARERTDKNGWPVGWRTILRVGGDAPFDLGDRTMAAERPDPLSGRSR